MKQSSFPTKFALPFAGDAGSGYIRTIPQASQVGVTAGAASLTDGFPPVTFDPVSAGGTPPSGADMNGILNWVTSVLQAYQSGYFGVWDGTFATAIGGYPMNAIVSGATAGTYYVSTVDDNMTTPGASGASWQSLFTGLQVALGYTPPHQGGQAALNGNTIYLGLRNDVTSGAARVGLFVDSTDFGAIATIGAGNLGQSGSTEQYYQLAAQGSKTVELTFNAFVAGIVHAEASANYSSQNSNQSVLSLSINGVTVSSDEVTGTTCMSNGGCAAVSPGTVTIASYCGTSATSPPNIGHTLRYLFVPT